MNKRPQAISISWSGGKDSALALWRVLQDNQFEVVELHTLVNIETQRVGLHGIKRSLIEQQAEQLDLPLTILELNKDTSNASFEKVTSEYYRSLKSQGIHHVMFGDIFLEDLKNYRDKLLKQQRLQGYYPLLKEDTLKIANQFIDLGFQTTICAANPDHFSFPVAGEPYSKTLLELFPPEVDPCGENGEFHSFVHSGPIFQQSIRISVGESEIHEYQFKDEKGVEKTSRMEFVEIRSV